MKTVSTLCASGAGIGIAPVGLALIRQDVTITHHLPRDLPSRDLDMTAVASPYSQLSHNLPTTFLHPQTGRSVSEGQYGKVRSNKAKIGQKRTLAPSASFSLGAEEVPERENTNGQRVGTPNSQPSSWLRRFSSSMTSSRDSSRTPTSRPGSQSNSLMAFSNAGSTTPMFPDTTPTHLPPNKLVKRSSSLRSSNGLPFSSSGSKLPRPVLRRPATSHQRSVTLHQSYPAVDQSDRMSIDESPSGARDTPLRHYFTPKSAPFDWSYARRKTSSGIPTPIRRVYPDRKYTPLLTSGSYNIKPAALEFDNDAELVHDDVEPNDTAGSSFVASSPLPGQGFQTEEGLTPRRSFTFGELLSSGPQQLWKRPSQKKPKTSGSKSVRRRGLRVVSAPEEPMGNSFSIRNGADNERPAKRRDVTNPRLTPRSIYSSSSSNQIEAYFQHDAQLNFADDKPITERFNGTPSPTAEAALANARPTSPFEQRRLPSATSMSAVARSARVSAAPSEIVSFGDSDSEYRSIGDASTDYQSDTVFNSYNTRTTRSSSGRRGPHIEKIFQESPPAFSSDRSTKLKDLLDDGSLTGTDSAGQYRHSTIEEESSITSTPVKSLQANSVISTPSARLGASSGFPSSPPVTNPLPDTDDIDWDVSDEDMDRALPADEHTPSVLNTNSSSLPFRFGPILQDSYSNGTASTPDRVNGGSAEKQNLFDWSEIQPSPSDASPARPRTVHGKKDPESRGSRAVGRRQPSGMHARSHSVPVPPESGARKASLMANRFGTWGVGSRVVTEDWNEDFAFDEANELGIEDDQQEGRLADTRRGMLVPRSIREQQDNVVANIGLLREWGLLIEELKELRMRAVALDMLKGRYASEWEEVDAMIDLADQETEEETLQPRTSPPSSPNFDHAAFEEQLRQSTRLPDSLPQLDLMPPPMLVQQKPAGSSTQSDATRPRKDSEAVTRSVIEALLSKRSVSDPVTSAQARTQKKLPFDTATLRHIVPHVNNLKRRVKNAVRETEDLHTSPQRSRGSNAMVFDGDEDDEPPFQSPFSEGMARRRSRREQAVTDHDGADDPWADQGAELASRVQKMNLPR